MEILDMKCAEYGNKIVVEVGTTAEKNKIETMITKALGVLQEDGIYAFALYSKAKSGNENTAKMLYDKACELLKYDKISLLPKECNDLLIGIRDNLSSDLDKLFLAKELLERTLVYARYHAKALDSGSSGGGAS